MSFIIRPSNVYVEQNEQSYSTDVVEKKPEPDENNKEDGERVVETVPPRPSGTVLMSMTDTGMEDHY